MKIDYALLLLKLSGFTGGPCIIVTLFNFYEEPVTLLQICMC